MFKHLLLSLGGSVAVGGIGYGIYSSLQISEKESVTDVGDSKSPSGDQGGGSEQPEEKVENETEQGGGGGTGGTIGSNSTITPGSTHTQSGASEEGVSKPS